MPQESAVPVRGITLFACILGICVVVAWATAGAYMLAKSSDLLKVVLFASTFPLVAWIANFSVIALVRRTQPANPAWPFASPWVLLVYAALLPLLFRVIIV